MQKYPICWEWCYYGQWLFVQLLSLYLLPLWHRTLITQRNIHRQLPGNSVYQQFVYIIRSIFFETDDILVYISTWNKYISYLNIFKPAPRMLLDWSYDAICSFSRLTSICLHTVMHMNNAQITALAFCVEQDNPVCGILIADTYV